LIRDRVMLVVIMSKSRIEIIALGVNTFYSIGTVEVTSGGEVYAIMKRRPVITKISRHVSGQTHVENEVLGKKITRQGSHLDNFIGLEWLHTAALTLASLESSLNEYQLKKSNGIFCIDMRAYHKAAFNLAIGILTKEGINDFYNSHEMNSKKQFYLFWG
jgi:hypothetical protein